MVTAVNGQTQTGTISGQIINDNTHQALPYVNISIKSKLIGTTSNAAGYFNLGPVNRGKYTLSLSYIGFEDQAVEVIVPQTQPITLVLKPELIEMSTLVVTGTRTERLLKDVPVTTQVIKGKTLSETGGADVSQALGYVTGVAVVENQFGTGVELSGFDANHVLVMVDGLKMIGRTNGQLDISQIPIEQIKRIEIVKGAASALYGSEAMGGVINIITTEADNNFGVKLGSVIGSYGRLNSTLTLSGGVRGFRSKLNVNSRFYGGNTLNTGSLWENGSQYEKLNLGFQTTGELTSTLKLNLHLNHFQEIQTTDLQVFNDVTRNQRNAGRLELTEMGQLGTWILGLDYSGYDHLYQRLVSSSAYVKTADNTVQQLLRSELRGIVEHRQQTLMMGIGHEQEMIASDRITGRRQQSALTDLFLQDEFSATQRFSGILGLRWDYHTIYGNYLSPKISLMLKPELISRIRLSFGQGFRAPTFKELFLDYTVESIGYRIIGNPALMPERSNNLNLDIERWHTQQYHGRINLFYNRISNLIDYTFQGVEQNLQLWQTANINRAITSGVEIDLNYYCNKQMEWTIGYAYLNTWDVDNQSPINLKAKHKANTSLRINLGPNTNLNLGGQCIGDRFFGEAGLAGDVESTQWIASYTLWNINFQQRFKVGFDLNGGLKNITDVFDPVWGPMPGREWYLGLNYNYIKNER